MSQYTSDDRQWMCAVCSWIHDALQRECDNCQHQALLNSWVPVRFNSWYGQWEVLS